MASPLPCNEGFVKWRKVQTSQFALNGANGACDFVVTGINSLFRHLKFFPQEPSPHSLSFCCCEPGLPLFSLFIEKQNVSLFFFFVDKSYRFPQRIEMKSKMPCQQCIQHHYDLLHLGHHCLGWMLAGTKCTFCSEVIKQACLPVSGVLYSHFENVLYVWVSLLLTGSSLTSPCTPLLSLVRKLFMCCWFLMIGKVLNSPRSLLSCMKLIKLHAPGSSSLGRLVLHPPRVPPSQLSVRSET